MRVKRRPATDPKLGKETWQVIDPDGKVLRENGYGEGAIVALAQSLAQKCYDGAVELTVRWKATFGEPDTLYRVVREEDGSISTWRT